MKIQIKPGLEIGDGCPPFIIAEVGSNWTSLDDCLLSIEKAKECGADSVKFQLFNHEALYGIPPAPTWTLYSEDIDRDVEIHRASLPLLWLPALKEKADRCGIEFMCSAFSPELIDAVDPFVKVHKLASAEMCHVRMLEKLRAIGKPVFMSTGAHTMGEIQLSIDCLYGRNTQVPDKDHIPLVLMYCVAAYPAREIQLGNILNMLRKFNMLIGFSDHSLDVFETPTRASERGACVIEKHFTCLSDGSTPDSAHSLSPDQFRQMVHSIRGQRSSAFGPVSEELPMILRHNRRLIATQDINAGETLVEGMTFGIYRSLKDSPKALKPYMVNEVNGKKALRDIKAGDGICEEDV